MKNALRMKQAARGLVMGGTLAGLAACGGSTATTPTVVSAPVGQIDPTPIDPTPKPVAGMSVTQMRSAQASLISQYNPVTYTPLQQIPTRGTVAYSGYMDGALSNTNGALTDSVAGQMQLEVTFTDDSLQVGGQVTSFRDADNNPMTGSLTLSGGNLDRNGNLETDATFTLSADGTLRDAAGNDLVFGTTLEGDFLGAAHNSVGGDVLGRVIHDGASHDFDGTFIAER